MVFLQIGLYAEILLFHQYQIVQKNKFESLNCIISQGRHLDNSNYFKK